MSVSCFFCGRPVNKGKGVNKHHVIPKRYGVPTPIHLAHETCHRRAHMELDNPRWSWKEFESRLSPLKFGEGIYAD
jgi:hypothetical protein